ncbi:spore germination protein [Calditerricola satsumensis]|uniref:Spore germination protein n=1 Tax=Calditerricola satsumensis TaxID=373054 RepID=A0A8J3FAY1_9BACI|nr:spore germination protein [Calditerricola satsumensis]GGJ94185.1 spore germination protein [Calditerricola satsumensis]
MWKGKRKQKKQALTDRPELRAYFDQKIEARAEDTPIHTRVDENVSRIQDWLGHPPDLLVRQLHIRGKTPAAIVYFDVLVDTRHLNEHILNPLLTGEEDGNAPYVGLPKLWDVLQVGSLREVERMADALRALLSGCALLFVQGASRAVAIDIKGWEMRSVDEPRAESVVRGPREALMENAHVNLGLLRARMRDPDLRVERRVFGQRTQTDVYILYIDGIVNTKALAELKRRLDNIRIDGMLDSGYLEELIEDSSWSPFPQVQATERPDKVAAHLLEGKIAILVNGSPLALIVPAVFHQFYHAAEDYYERALIASLVRIIRLFSLIISLLLPSLYIAFVSFHPEMLPTELAIAMAAGRATVPFPSIIEALIMEVMIEILREASVRLPGPIGPTIGIVGGLVIGESAVRAGLVSPLMVIIVAVTTIGSFAIPSYSAAIPLRMLRFPLMFISASFGLYGLMIGVLLILLHLSTLKSFGVPYLAPLTPFRPTDSKDVLLRFPWTWLRTRPQMFRPRQDIRNATPNRQPSDEEGSPA